MRTRFSNYFRSMVIIHEGAAAIFASDLMLPKLKEAKSVSFDGTFYVVPKLFYQLFTIFIQEQHHAFPAIHILMSSKNDNLYTAVLQKIVEMIPDFQP